MRKNRTVSLVSHIQAPGAPDRFSSSGHIDISVNTFPRPTVQRSGKTFGRIRVNEGVMILEVKNKP